MLIRNLIVALTCAGLLAACGGKQEPAEETAVAEQPMETDESTSETADEPMSGTESAPGEMHGKMHGDKAGMHGKMDGDKAGMHGKMHDAMMKRCPMHVEGTSMEMKKVDAGIAIEFTNTENPGEVQERARAMAAHHIDAMEQHGSHFGGYNVATEDTDTGSKLVLTPPASGDVEAFQNAVMERHASMKNQQCPAMLMYKMKS